MHRVGKASLGLVVAGWLLAHPQGASAQVAPAPGTTMPPAGMMMNPYMNPYLNPYLNPAATQGRMTTGNALLYMYAAQSANGGIGSGRLSTGSARAQTTRTRAAELPNSANQPGAGAARYFNAGPPGGGGAGRYYNRTNRYFNNNGR